MKKRTFLKLTSTLMTGTVLANITSCNQDKPTEQLKNWAGNLTYSTTKIAEPKTVEEVQEIVRKCTRLRTLGTRHCFNQIADSRDNLLSTKYLNSLVTLDSQGKTVTTGGGMRYGEFCKQLHEKGFAVHNLASLPHISVAGACATATHGSGVGNGNLATSISAIEFVRADGDVVLLSKEKDGDQFLGAVVGLGCLGVVTKVTLDLVPTFSMQQEVYLNLPILQLETHFDEIMSAGYSVSLFTDWQTSNINQVWVKRSLKDGETYAAPKEFFGATLATRNVHPIIEISAENCTEQMSVPGPWYERLPHFKMGFTPSSGEELQAEYFVPRKNAVEAIKAVQALKDEIKPLLMITEIRTIAADDLWMSPCYHQDSVAIHFTLNQNTAGVMRLLPKIEEKLSPFDVRPHWGKLFTLDPKVLQSRYEKLNDFRALISKYDPDGKFRNEFVNRNIFGVA
ncbi:D-arabinono-1,4-lactone oxidase [Chryseolinea sp. H1M3-3]|uniref:D-arabinono-1,4-lactone oxidase n=1 Tax=Chryseolinea sp. H1M3-3 TaxID=3034144 RepID=UPI0023ED8BB7|nr:D-arabinono-1,4-lactone oxidase [Chryseolinea sp. H1M3-3]